MGNACFQEYLAPLKIAVGGVEVLDVFLGMQHGLAHSLGAGLLFQIQQQLAADSPVAPGLVHRRASDLTGPFPSN